MWGIGFEDGEHLSLLLFLQNQYVVISEMDFSYIAKFAN